MIAQGKEKKKDYKEGCNMEQGVLVHFDENFHAS